MKTLSISGSLRHTLGKKDTSSLRKAGKVPCVLYGGKQNIHFSATEKDFKKLIYNPDIHLVKLDVGEQQFDAILQEVQFHPVTDRIQHIDFLEVLPDKPILMKIPVRLNGTPAGIKEGGKLLKKLQKATVKGLISKIPDAIELDVSEMKVGDSIKIRDLKYEGVTFLHEPNVTVAAVKIIVEPVETPATVPVAAEGATPAAGSPGAPATAPTVKEEKKEEKKK